MALTAPNSELVSMGKTLCVILHYGSEEDTNRCLASLQSEDNLEIVISDNDPAQTYDPPIEFSNTVKIIKTGGRAGFSEGNNIGVNAFLHDRHDSVFILNNDTIVQEGAIKLLRECLLNEGVGAVGPCMPFADQADKIWACGGYINRQTLVVGGLQPKSQKPYEVDYLPGAAILTRSDLWEKIGGLSEKYFLAYEEAEYALEVKKLGYRVMVEPNSIILHKVGMSGQSKPQYFYNSVRNRIIFSKYLYGSFIGFIYGALMTLRSLRSRRFLLMVHRLRLWHEAVFDEFLGNPFDKQRLREIELRYQNK
jgi:GT2 family glycosyltransferase